MFTNRVFLLFMLMSVAQGALAQNPVKLTSGTRFDLMASANVGAIEQGAVLAGHGSMQRMNWIPAADQPRSYTCNFPVIHFGWTEIVVQFTPRNSGRVDLTLMGPWEQSSEPGNPIYRQEVLWDALSSSPVVVANGSFETVNGGVPAPWTRPYGDGAVDTGPVAPVEGVRYARTWHDGSWRQALNVTGGQPVTLRFFSRAHLPAGFVDNPRLTDPDTPAHQARLKFMRGVNLGNYLEAPAGQNWGQTYSAADFAQIRAEGFDHVRLPVRWNDYAGPAPGFSISETFALKVDAVVDGALAHGLGVLVNIHHFDAFTTDPFAETAKFYRLWEQIAARYASRPNAVAFELLNEPKDAATTTVLNPIYEEAIGRIRLTNPQRTIFVGPGSFNSISQLPSLHLPAADANLIVTVHSYDPFLFTHQGTTWSGEATATIGVVYPGPPATPKQPTPPANNQPWVVDWFNQYNALPAAVNPSSKAAFVGSLELARTWSDYYGRPVHVGEFGCYELADPISRANYYREMRETMEGLGLGWAMWDWKAGFKYWDGRQGQAAPGLPEAMFPPPGVRMLTPGRLRIESAVGKRHRVWRSTGVETPRSTWTSVWDELLEIPVVDFVDPEPQADRAFYSVEWVK
jgi:endoglucanase